MALPKAVASSTKTPGLYLSLNLLASAASPGTAPLRALMMGPKSSSGTITADSQLVEAVGGPDDVKTYSGPGTQAHLAAVKLFNRYPLALVDYVAPAVGAGNAATGTVTFSGTVTAAHIIEITICGYKISIPWPAGTSASAIVASCVSYINGFTDFIPVTASDSTGGVLTLTAKYAGTWGNDVRFYSALSGGAGGAAADSAAALASGTGDPDFTNALSLVSVKEYDIILPCLSNTDAVLGTTSSNGYRLKTHINTYNSGLGAKLQTALIGVTSTSTSAAKTGPAYTNEGNLEYAFGMNFVDLPCQVAACETADRLKREALEFGNANRIGTSYPELYGAKDKVADKPTAAEIEDCLNSGLSIFSYDGTNTPYIVAPITGHFKDSNGAADSRIYYVTEVTGANTVMKDLRAALPQEFVQVKIAPNQEGADEPLPPNTVEERDVEGFCLTRLRYFQRQGVIQKAKLDAAIADGTLIVQIDDTDESQVNIVLPFAIVKPLAKFSLVGQKLA